MLLTYTTGQNLRHEKLFKWVFKYNIVMFNIGNGVELHRRQKFGHCYDWNGETPPKWRWYYSMGWNPRVNIEEAIWASTFININLSLLLLTSFNQLIGWLVYFMCLGVFPTCLLCVYASHVCFMAMDIIRGHYIPWDWSYK